MDLWTSIPAHIGRLISVFGEVTTRVPSSKVMFSGLVKKYILSSHGYFGVDLEAVIKKPPFLLGAELKEIPALTAISAGIHTQVLDIFISIRA